ncbi:putative ergosterol biosynthetic protein 28 homolog [Caenorhabditis elegans]|uniref:Probable ergosterol biosynthetic protein 28 homolog n=1 Tax=Caenorhabditis elegans TaxID=6239 RepID=ERG28_CAEEL|nr:putative ergosterol biosynthetic protein 28 homolog [Caenorhabditis elegans]G5EEQ9.1 RecName: Full=Probable ergosterol biosynthetic protein 28 homolog [Caenorhabditis elegans]CAC42259.1 Probable ergosterol biosynthetic protein 28 homolog [Caenorhabditis elegans]|eukprot:NP_506154.1 Probable ergosterol biosynthetic protein 28 homolog [Caenorhabditis elegans]
MERSTRAWMSIVVVQAMGSVWMCYAKQNSASHYTSTLPALSRAHALPLALLCILRIVLIFDFRNFSIHIAHILLSILTAIHTMTEVFFYQSMSYGIVTVTEVTLNSFSVVVMLTFLLSPSFKNEQEGKEKRARKVTAKHYMEGEMLTPEDDDELVQAYKKWK